MPKYVELLKLQKHIEGGYFGLFYKSEEKVSPFEKNFQNHQAVSRFATSSIYFLLEKNDFSAWHRLKSDEIWHYYDGGSPIEIHVIDKEGIIKTFILGNPSITKESSFQVVIKAGNWFAADLRDKTSFALVGCTVSPGFEYEDFELAERDILINKFPKLKNEINKYLHTNTQNSMMEQRSQTDVSKRVLKTITKFSVQDYIKNLQLTKHIEGGYYSVFYKSENQVLRASTSDNSLPEEKAQNRSAGSSIYFLLEKQDFSAWHRLSSDEIWHYYDGGSPIDIYVIDTEGHINKFVLGNPNMTSDASFQRVIKKGNWFAAEVRDKSSFALVGCTVSPGFEYQDFELANRQDLIKQHQKHADIIKKFTRVTLPIKSWSSQAVKLATIALISGAGLYLANNKLFNQDSILNTFSTHIKARLGI